MDNKLAIIIPYYKLTFFEKTLNSLASQTNKNFKVYIGDDASPSNLEMILKKYEGKFDFYYHRFANNLGGTSLPKQWERCIELSNDEEWLMILGDDDWMSETVVEEFYKNLSLINKKYNLIRFATKVFNVNNNTITDTYKHPVNEKYSDTYIKKMRGLSRSSLSEYIFKRQVYKKYGFKEYPLAWNSDDRAWFDFSESKPVHTINDALLFISISNESITGKADNIKEKNKSELEFYSYLFWGLKLNLIQKVEISKLIIKLPKQIVPKFTRFTARCILKFYNLFIKRK